ncbi:MAG: hypothetical protein RKO66_14300 [Candidatus Contendobacter sp.]|nr:hypothetical protein [Candidatus Contendobacter sp.]MDS4031224.1 hypothetical protein [Candidatus Contendobacter sp.]
MKNAADDRTAVDAFVEFYEAFEELRKVCRTSLRRSFAKSWLACLDDDLYFPTKPEEYPDPALRLLHPDLEAIAELADQDYFTLWEAALLIDWRAGRLSFLTDAWRIFADAIADGDLSPRHPDNQLRWIHLPVDQRTQLPDFTWGLFRDEVYQFAAARYPQHLFSDLRGPDQATEEPKPSIRPQRKTMVIAEARRILLNRNREPTPIEVWDFLISGAGHPDSGVAEFLDVETENGEGPQGKIVFDTADGGVSRGTTFKALQNALTKIRDLNL